MYVSCVIMMIGFRVSTYAALEVRDDKNDCHELLARRDAHKEELDHQKYIRQTPVLFQEELQEPVVARARRAQAKVLKKIERYAELDGLIPSIANEPLAALWGGIHYGMSLEEMQQSVNALFGAMHAEGKIISRAHFETIKEQYYTESSRRAQKDLSRLWGSLYLKDAINKSDYLREKYEVPDYLIVSDGQIIEVELIFHPLWPIIWHIKNASLYFKRVKGVFSNNRIMHKNDIGRASGIGFRDLLGRGNVIHDLNADKYYVVDTEFKSFHIAVTDLMKELCEYASKKFIYLYTADAPFYIMQITLSE